ncbi:MAG: hypothetical protein GX934_00880 [Burkholderiales bacterium]|nr:hypothetical protein [Burkholderiales bacterium]
MTMPTPEFEAFLRSFYAPLDNRAAIESFNLDALCALQGEERAQAEQLLIDQLAAGVVDTRVPDALAAMGSTAAPPYLHEALAALRAGPQRIAVAKALAALEPGFDNLSVMTGSLDSIDPRSRVDVAYELRHIPGAEADEALIAALADPDEIVRLNAQDSLFEKYGLQALRRPFPSKTNELALALTSSLAAVRAPAIAELRRILQGLQEGQTHEALGLVYPGEAENVDQDSFAASFHARRNEDGPWRQDYDLAALRRLPAYDRPWIQVMLHNGLAGCSWRDPDPRAPRAMAALGWTDFLPALQEARAGATGELAQAIDQAIATLQSDSD